MNNSTEMRRQFRVSNVILSAALILTVTIFLFDSFGKANAQTPDRNWTVPTNLSNSGAATNPEIVIDSQETIHVIWSDEFSGNVYTRTEGEEWLQPMTVQLPSEDIIPRLIADNEGYIHAFWLDELGSLSYSRVSAENFSSSGSWMPIQTLSEGVLTFDMTIDSEGWVHLGYVSSLESEFSPAGLYYQKMNPGNLIWSSPSLLYQSSYFRSQAREQSNVSIATRTDESGVQVFIGVDNRLRERVFFLRSQDRGESWSEPEEVDRPQEGDEMGGPANIQLFANSKYLLRLWQSERTESQCDQNYQWSMDGGLTWENEQQLFEGLILCPQEIQFLEDGDNLILLIKDIQVYLLAWDGNRWSDPQLQINLTSFIDPEINKLIDLSCQQAIAGADRTLVVIGCGISEAQDIWFMKRQIEDLSEWFPDNPVWSPLELVASSDVLASSLSVLSDGSNRIHLLWGKEYNPLEEGRARSFDYTRWEAGRWSSPVPILALTEGKVSSPDLAFNQDGRLFAVWSGGQYGEIYFSYSDAGRAGISSSWSEPKLLPSLQQAGSSPKIRIDEQGRILVIYAVPLNEDRGIYLTISNDGGETWSDPIQVFNGVSAGWAMVDEPELALTDEGQMHVLWTRFSLPSGAGPLALVYSRSDDGGQSWSGPDIVTDKPTPWSELIVSGERTVHRVWEEVSSSGVTIWHERSEDGGLSWTRISPVSVFGEAVTVPDLISDVGGRLHLFQVIKQDNEILLVQHWIWDNLAWTMDENLDVDPGIFDEINLIKGSISPEGKIAIALSGMKKDSNTGRERNRFYSSSRMIDVSQSPATPVPLQTPVPAPTQTPTQTPNSIQTTTPDDSTAVPMPTATISLIGSEPPSGSSSNLLLRILTGMLIAGVIFFLAVLAYFLVYRSRRYSRNL
jgi:hypothetical protein